MSSGMYTDTVKEIDRKLYKLEYRIELYKKEKFIAFFYSNSVPRVGEYIAIGKVPYKVKKVMYHLIDVTSDTTRFEGLRISIIHLDVR